ncbi:MAG: hypothetical protein ACKO37_01185 [Vampirovibrionales bacterium]
MISLHNFFSQAFHRDEHPKHARKKTSQDAKTTEELASESTTLDSSAPVARERLKAALQEDIEALNRLQAEKLHAQQASSVLPQAPETHLIENYSPLKQYVGVECIETYTPTRYETPTEASSMMPWSVSAQATALLEPSHRPSQLEAPLTQVHKSFWEGCLYQVSPTIHIVTYHSYMAGQRYTHTLKTAAGILNYVKMGQDQIRQTFQMNDWHATQHFLEGRSLVLRHFTQQLTMTFQPTQDALSVRHQRLAEHAIPSLSVTEEQAWLSSGTLGDITLQYDLWSGNYVLGRYEKSWRFFG